MERSLAVSARPTITWEVSAKLFGIAKQFDGNTGAGDRETGQEETGEGDEEGPGHAGRRTPKTETDRPAFAGRAKEAHPQVRRGTQKVGRLGSNPQRRKRTCGFNGRRSGGGESKGLTDGS